MKQVAVDSLITPLFRKEVTVFQDIYIYIYFGTVSSIIVLFIWKQFKTAFKAIFY